MKDAPFSAILFMLAIRSTLKLCLTVCIASWAAWSAVVADRVQMAGCRDPKAVLLRAAVADTSGLERIETRSDIGHARAARLTQQLTQPIQTIVRPPFVLAGDLSETELQEKLDTTIQPVCEALLASYFCKRPDRPVLILMFTTETAYRRAAEQLFFDREVSRFGYYKPGRQAILVNLAEGDEALFHELTHVLMDTDFPDAPQWLQEGLATLHETSEICPASRSVDGDSLKMSFAAGATAVGRPPQGLTPLLNWRGAVLRRARSEGRLPGLQQLITLARFRGADEALDYAHARYFCLFLYQRGVLERFYVSLRQRAETDPTGGQTLLEVLAARDWGAVDGEFQTWLDDLDCAAPLE